MTRRGLAVFGLGSLMSAMTLVTGRADPIGFVTEWTGHKAGRVRLLASTVPASGGARIKPAKLYAGVHVKLADGWKTYWRQPGEAGVPPGFDWAGSVNVAEARVLFPVPQRLIEAGMSLGYKHEVVFPVEITPSDPGQADRAETRVRVRHLQGHLHSRRSQTIARGARSALSPVRQT